MVVGGGWGGRWGGVGGGGGCRERLSLNFAGAKNTPPSFRLARRCRPLADMSPARVGSTRHHRKIRRLFLRGSPAKIQTKASTPRPADGGHGRALEGGA